MRHLLENVRWGGAAAIVAGAMALGGCSMPNSSNPVLTLESASVTGDRATLGVRIDNPSDMDVRINAVTWSLVYGPLPVADGSWDMGVEIPSKGTHQFSKQVRFDQPPLDPSVTEIELSGSMSLETIGNKGKMALEEAGFSSTTRTRR